MLKSKNRYPKPICLGILFVLCLVISSCGTVQHVAKFEKDFSPSSITTVEVGTVTNESGETFDIDITKMLEDALVDALENNNLLWTGGYDGNHIIIISKIVDYKKGDAFKRWVLPGWGSTVLSVQSDLKENPSGKIIGSVEARRTVSIGGGYTIGAWKTVFKSLAKDIVKELSAKIGKSIK